MFFSDILNQFLPLAHSGNYNLKSRSRTRLPKALHLDSISGTAVLSGALTPDHVVSFTEKLTWHIQQPLHEHNLKSTKACMYRGVENETMCI